MNSEKKHLLATSLGNLVSILQTTEFSEVVAEIELQWFASQQQ